jgi:hypothetical protein
LSLLCLSQHAFQVSRLSPLLTPSQWTLPLN